MSKSSTTTSRGGLLLNPHPGEILLEEFVRPLALSQNRLAREIHVPQPPLSETKKGSQASLPATL